MTAPIPSLEVIQLTTGDQTCPCRPVFAQKNRTIAVDLAVAEV